MKPTKNHYYCVGSRRSKMLFETKSKADNFIKYNREGILEENGRAPVRSYYCSFCGGYHVTSIRSTLVGEKLDELDKQRLESLLSTKKGSVVQAPKPVVNVTIVERMNKVKTLLLFGHVGIAEDLLNVCELELKELAGMMSSVTGDLSKKLKRVEQLRSLLDDVKAILNQSDDELRASISMPKTEDVVKSLHIIRHNVLVKRTIFRMLSENDELLDKGQTKEVAERLAKCRDLISTIKGEGKNEEKEVLKKCLVSQEERLSKVWEKQYGTQVGFGDILRIINIPSPEGNVTVRKNVGKEAYKSTVLLLINKLEIINHAYQENDLDTCENEYEIACFILDDFGVDDDNTKLIHSQLDKWSEVLYV